MLLLGPRSDRRRDQARREAEGARAASRQKSGRWKKAGSSERRRARRSGGAARRATWPGVAPGAGEGAGFAPGAGGFSVEVEVGVGDSEDFGGFWEVADEIEHGAVASGSGG